MPTVLRDQGFQVRIYLPPREHDPPHVHVVKGKGEVIFRLNGESMPPTIWKVFGMSDRDVVSAYRLVEANVNVLLEKWKEYHGKTS